MWWYAVIGVVIVVVAVAWIINSARLAKRNRNLDRRGPRTFTSGKAEVDERNRSAPRAPRGPHGSTEPQPRPAAPELDPYWNAESQPEHPAQSGPEQRP